MTGAGAMVKRAARTARCAAAASPRRLPVRADVPVKRLAGDAGQFVSGTLDLCKFPLQLQPFLPQPFCQMCFVSKLNVVILEHTTAQQLNLT